MPHPSRTELVFERKAENKKTSRKEREGMKPRDIHLKYPDKVKANALMDRLFKAGMYRYDPDFPKDSEDSM